MTTKNLTNRLLFLMCINDYDALHKFFREDGRTFATFLRVAIMKEINSYEIDCEINQILALGYNNKCKQQVNFRMSDNDYGALKKFLKNVGVSASTFFRYLTKKELRRLDIEKEKNQTWDLD